MLLALCITFFTAYPYCFLCSLLSMALYSDAFPNKFLRSLPFFSQWFSVVVPSLMHFYAAYPSSFCAAYSMALCGDVFHYVFLRSLPFFFLCSILNGSLWCLPLCIFKQPTLLLSVQHSQLLSVVPSLVHFYAACPSSFCAAFSIALCSDAFTYAFSRNLPFFFLCSLLNGSL